jgi:uncharacterized membrane protein YbhN (UPF0104 family)
MITLSVWGLLGYQIRQELYQSDHRLELTTIDWLYFGLAIALLPLNYFLETIKWKRLIQPIEPDLRFKDCLKAVLVGASYGLFTPNRIGEYIGRLGAIQPEKRWQAGVATFWNRITQMMATLWMGVAGFIILAYKNISIYHISAVLGVLLLFLITLGYIGILIKSPRLLFYTKRLKFIQQYHFAQKLLQGAGALSRRMMTVSLLLAFGRYSVFSLQYALLFWGLSIKDDFLLIHALGTQVFLIKSFVPSVALAELGIREVIAIYVFKQIGISTWIAIQATFALFLINLLLPAVVGAFLIPDWFKHKRHQS